MSDTNGMVIDGEIAAPESKPVRLAARVAELEETVAILAWLYAELMYSLRRAAVVQAVQQMGPQVQEAIVSQIMGGAQL